MNPDQSRNDWKLAQAFGFENRFEGFPVEEPAVSDNPSLVQTQVQTCFGKSIFDENPPTTNRRPIIKQILDEASSETWGSCWRLRSLQIQKVAGTSWILALSEQAIPGLSGSGDLRLEEVQGPNPGQRAQASDTRKPDGTRVARGETGVPLPENLLIFKNALRWTFAGHQ